jgi:hypothetical protein
MAGMAGGASSGMRMKAANSSEETGRDSQEQIAQSMIDALTDILRWERKQQAS